MPKECDLALPWLLIKVTTVMLSNGPGQGALLSLTGKVRTRKIAIISRLLMCRHCSRLDQMLPNPSDHLPSGGHSQWDASLKQARGLPRGHSSDATGVHLEAKTRALSQNWRGGI